MPVYLKQCSSCGTRVSPMADGTCPSCRVKSFGEASSSEVGTACAGSTVSRLEGPSSHRPSIARVQEAEEFGRLARKYLKSEELDNLRVEREAARRVGCTHGVVAFAVGVAMTVAGVSLSTQSYQEALHKAVDGWGATYYEYTVYYGLVWVGAAHMLFGLYLGATRRRYFDDNHYWAIFWVLPIVFAGAMVAIQISTTVMASLVVVAALAAVVVLGLCVGRFSASPRKWIVMGRADLNQGRLADSLDAFQHAAVLALGSRMFDEAVDAVHTVYARAGVDEIDLEPLRELHRDLGELKDGARCGKRASLTYRHEAALITTEIAKRLGEAIKALPCIPTVGERGASQPLADDT